MLPLKLGNLIVIVLAVVLGTSACVSTSVIAEAKPTPSTSVHTPPASTPTPTQEPVTCQNIVTPATQHALTAGGFEFAEDFEDKLRSEAASWGLLSFFEYGGVACQWGYPSTDNISIFAYSPLTAQQAAIERKRLVDEGWTAAIQLDGSEIWTPADLDFYPGNQPAYVFATGSWRFAWDISQLELFAR